MIEGLTDGEVEQLFNAARDEDYEEISETTVQCSRDALALYVRYGYVPTPHAIYEGVHKLQPGTMPVIGPERQITEQRIYWFVGEAVNRGQAARCAGSEEEALDELGQIAIDAVGLRMIADVPLG